MGKEEKVSKKDEIPKVMPQSITRSAKKTKTSVIVGLGQISSRSPSSSNSPLRTPKRGLEKCKSLKKRVATAPRKISTSPNHQEQKVQNSQTGIATTSATNNSNPVASSSTASEDVMEWEPTESEVLNTVHQLRKEPSLPQTHITDIHYLQARLPIKQNNIINSIILHVVIDTNIFLSHLPVVKTLVEDSYKNKVQILVPWMVLQELDLIKTKAEHKNKLEIMARKAAMFINIQASILKNPCFRIQTLSEYKSCINLNSDENADDKILQWCINLKNEIQGNILLLSNDIIFSAKASANGIQAMPSQDFVDQLPHLLGNHSRQSEAETNSPSSPVFYNSAAIPGASNSQILAEDKTNTDRVLPSKFLFQFEELVRIPFSQFLEFEMKEAFDHIWLHIVLVKPPWNLYDILRCVEKHWIAVFGYKYPKDLQSKFDHLRNVWKASKAAPSLNDDQRDSLIQTAVTILQAIQKVRHELSRVVNDCINSLQGLHNPRKQENDSCVINVFTRLWERFSFICETIKMSCEGHVTINSTIASRQEIIEGLQLMIPLLNHVEDVMSRFFQTAQMNPSSLEAISTDLSSCLLSATSRLGLQTESLTMPIEDLSRALLSFISVPEKKQLMENGLHQLRMYKLFLQSASSVLIHPSQ